MHFTPAGGKVATPFPIAERRRIGTERGLAARGSVRGHMLFGAIEVAT